MIDYQLRFHAAPDSLGTSLAQEDAMSGETRPGKRHMQRPLGSTGEFHGFQDHLFRHGQIDLAAIELEIVGLLTQLLSDSLKKRFNQHDYLAKLLLLRYCVAWAVASGEDLPPLVEDDSCYAFELMERHRQQMSRYAPHFPVQWRKLLSQPETSFDKRTFKLLVEFLREKQSLSGKGMVYMPALLFQEQLSCHAQRDVIPKPVATKAALWGKRNINDLVNGSSRSRYWMDRLIRQTGIGTNKAEKKPK